MRPAPASWRPSSRIEQIARYLHSRFAYRSNAVRLLRKPRGLVIEPDFVLVLKALEAAPLADCLSAIHDAIVALEPYDGVPFKRKPLVFRKTGGKAEPTAPGPEDTAWPPLNSRARTCRPFPQLGGTVGGKLHDQGHTTEYAKGRAIGGMLTPPQVAKQLGVSPDKVRGWIAKGELPATNVATGKGGRPRYRISETDLAEFQKKRQPSKPPVPAPRRRKKDPNVIPFF